MATSHIKQLTNRAQAIRRQHPKMSWQNALSKAGKMGGKKKSTTKKSTPRKKARIKGTHRTISAVPEMTLAQSKALTKKMLKERLGWLLAAKRTAYTKTDKNKFQDQISDCERAIKALEY